jgi:hypothetical protein
MKIIAHRGLTHGPNDSTQNHPSQIQMALHLGFEAEIDLWRIDNRLVLGHDAPEHEINLQFLRDKPLWIHCKNLDALFYLQDFDAEFNFFWHESDLVTLTSQLYIWTYFGKLETMHQRSICVMPEATYPWSEISSMAQQHAWYGFCTDHAEKLRACLD